ncbi:MAG TPA: magnesium transporter [Desulfobacteraceae bacterium]|nr:magnesium transporter [Desulfobacteraceae bacterium]
MSATEAYLTIINRFIEHDVVTAARFMESIDEGDASQILKTLPTETAVRVLRNFQVGFAATLLEGAGDAFINKVLPHLSPQMLTAILMHASAPFREQIKGAVNEAVQGQIRELLTYPEGSIGRIITTDFMSFDKDMVVQDAIDTIRTLSKKRRPASYAYVVDEDDHLLGVLNMRDMLIASPGQSLESIMIRDVFSLHGFMDVQEAAAELAKRKYFAAPVVDSEGRILGIIKAERLIKGVQEDTAQDIQRMFGAGGDEKPFSNIFFSLKKRLFWLHINLVTAFMAAGVVAMFEGVISKLTILAVFLPVVAGQGGNAGAQSLAVVMRGIAMREIPKEKTGRLILKEGGLGAINGVVIGIVTAVVAWFWNGNPYLGLVIGLGMFFNLIFAGLSGASIPLLMKRMGIDPAQSSSIILTTVTDILGFLAFLGFAVLFQSYLMVV